MNIFIVLGVMFLLVFIIGIGLERIRIPWIFGALLIGLGLAFNNPVQQITDSESFTFLAQLGMFFLLFLIGFQLDFKHIKGLKKIIITSSFGIIISEAIVGGIFIHFVFNLEWFVSIIVALSFATVGEAVLIPILDEFKITKTKFGQAIIGIGTFDDILEVLVVVLVAISLPSLQSGSGFNVSGTNSIVSALISLAGLFILAVALSRIKSRMGPDSFFKTNDLYPLLFAILFGFIGVGSLTGIDLSTLGALIAGLSVRNFLSKDHLESVEVYLKALTYGFFAPIFFLHVGLDTDMEYIFSYPLMICAIILIASAVKIAASCVIGRKEFGLRRSVVMGLALSVRFSTSIVIIKVLFQNDVIGIDLYSVLIGSTAMFTFIVPILLSWLIPKWHLQPQSAVQRS